MTVTIDNRFKLRRGYAAVLATVNEVPLEAELVLELDTHRMKVGDGSTAYNSLPYLLPDPLFAVAAGSADVLTADFVPNVVLTDGAQIRLRAVYANATSSPTLAVDGGTAVPIKKNGDQPLVAGDINGAGHELLLRYVAATTPRFELLNPASSSGGGVSSVVAGTGIAVDNTDPANPVVSATGLPSPSGIAYILIADVKASGTHGGSATAGSWNTRTLTTIVNDDTGSVTLSSNKFTLPAGSYIIDVECPAITSWNHKARLYNVTSVAVQLVGTSEWNNDSSQGQTKSHVRGKVVISSPTTFRIEHYLAQANNSDQTLGISTNISGVDEIYTTVSIVKM